MLRSKPEPVLLTLSIAHSIFPKTRNWHPMWIPSDLGYGKQPLLLNIHTHTHTHVHSPSTEVGQPQRPPGSCCQPVRISPTISSKLGKGSRGPGVGCSLWPLYFALIRNTCVWAYGCVHMGTQTRPWYFLTTPGFELPSYSPCLLGTLVYLSGLQGI